MKPKNIQDSKIFYSDEKSKPFQKEDGNWYSKLIWKLASNPISLGSVKKPNLKITHLKIEIPQDKPKRDENPFTKFFGGGLR